MRLTHPVSKRTRPEAHVPFNPSKLVPTPDKLISLSSAGPSHGSNINTRSAASGKLSPWKSGIDVVVAIKVLLSLFHQEIEVW